jgi:hypothetical protein
VWTFAATAFTILIQPDVRGAIPQPGITEKNYLLVASVHEDKVLRFDASTGAYVDDFIAASSGGLDEPSGIAIGPDGNLYVASSNTNRILRFNGQTGAYMNVFATNAQIPVGITFGPGGDLYVASVNGLSVLRYDGLTGASKGVFATTTAKLSGNPALSAVWWPWDLTFRSNGSLYLSSFERRVVLEFDGTTGQYQGVFADGRTSSATERAAGITFGPDNNLYMAGYFGEVVRFDGTNGANLGVFSDVVGDPTNIRFGPGGDLYVALRNRGAILRVDGQTGNVLGDFTVGGQWTSTHFLFFTNPVPEPTALLGATQLLAVFLLARRRRHACAR